MLEIFCQHILDELFQDSLNETLLKRPRFVTTVPQGIFLPPPRDIPLPPYISRHVYAYSSHPMVFNSSGYNFSNTKLLTNSKDNNVRNTAPAKMTDSDKEFKKAIPTTTTAATTYSRLNGLRGHLQQDTTKEAKNGGNRNATATNMNSTTGTAGAIHISKQQFLQQVQQNRSKR